MLRYYVLFSIFIVNVKAYNKQLFYFVNRTRDEFELQCAPNDEESIGDSNNTYDTVKKLKKLEKLSGIDQHFTNPSPSTDEDPVEVFRKILHRYIFGPSVDMDLPTTSTSSMDGVVYPRDPSDTSQDKLAHYPCGKIMRGELFNNRSAVHLTLAGYLHPGHARLNMTDDYMQVAVDAFNILLEGSKEDILNLSSKYVMKSARTIAMMRLPYEKLTALWTVVKGINRSAADVTIEELEMYRPLFKYVNAREMARLNLTNDRILSFIGTHADLNRHQVGVVASKYIQMNKNWSQPQYLNLMNNLICGMPMTVMRRIHSDILLQLTHEVFYHIHACDPLQRRFYLTQMSKTEALGKSYSWSARDVSRLGLLLAQVVGPEIAAINPEAIAGITSQVMLQIPAQNLQFFTPVQLKYLALKPLNIFARRLKAYQGQLGITRGSDRACLFTSQVLYLPVLLIKLF